MPSKRPHPIPAGYRAIAGSERRPSPSARVVGAADPNEVFRVTLVLRRRPDGEKPADYDDFLLTPPADRQRMSRDDFVAKYGAADDDLRKVTDFLTDRGLEVIEVHPDRRQVIAEGTVATFAEAFAVKLERYEHTVKLSLRGEPTTETYRGRDGEVYVPESLHGIVLGVFGLDNRRVGKTNGNPEPPNTTTVSVPTVSKLYDYPTNSASGQTIGIFSLSGYDSTDITTYFTNLGAGFTAPTVTDIPINGATNPGSDPFGETTQDIEIAAAFAPGSAVNVYITTGDQAGWVQALGRVAHPDPGDSAPSVLSSSWFISDGDDTAGMADQGVSSAFITAVTAAFQDAAIQGVTVCIASGDRGTDSNVGDGNAHVQYPGSDPWVLCVGGTTVGNINGTSFDEYVWNDPQTGNWGTTGGGVSARFPIPSYQSSLSLPSAVNTPTYTGRCVPDVAGNANIKSGYSGIILAGATTVGNGTSASAPQWAGLIAVLNAALGVNLGFINPALYALGSDYFRDIVPGAGPADNSNSGVTGYQAGAGWDACTGWGSPKGNLLLSGLRSIFTRSLYFVVDKSTFGHDEVADIITTSGGFYSSAFWLVLEGVSIHQLGTLTPTLGGAFDSLQMQGVTIFPDPSGPSFEDPSDLYTPQRIRFAYNVIFTSTSIAPMATVFPGAGLGPNFDVLTASITAPGSATPLQAEAVFELVSGADPYFTNVDPQTHQAFYLSQDIRVFSGVEGDSPVPGGPALTSDGYGSIQAILAYVNGNASWTTPAPGDQLNSLPGQGGYETADSSVTPLVGGQPNFNFAIARVRLQGAAGDTAANVRVFFRLWVAQSFDTDFQPTTTYLSTTGTGVEAGLPVAPLPSGSGITDPHGNSVQTVPFFATGASGPHDYDGTNANANIRSIVVPGGRDKTWAYFGCFLDVYNTAHQSIFAGDHHCIVAQIAYDDAPIVNSNGVTQSPENSDKLAQRNLQITSSGNPGWPDTHRIPQAFDARRSPTAVATGQMQDWPDELMIDWGAVPVGSTAQLYWPEADAADVIALAQKLYGKTRLKALDAHTLGIATTRGVSFVPIPFGAAGENLAGLFSVDLPNTIAVGQIFDIRVRRVASRRMGRQQPPPTGPTIDSTLSTKGGGRGLSRNWRYVTGTFQVQIPVGDERQLLVPEKNKLAVLKWRLERYPAQYRWRPVMVRYIKYVSGRVDGFGGDASDVPPSILGWPGKRHPAGGTEGGPGGGLGDGRRGCVGKVAAILFDAFGDFKGFELVTELGARHAYGDCEPEVESLVREAWSRRILIEVVAIEHAPHRALAIVFLREPRQIHA